MVRGQFERIDPLLPFVVDLATEDLATRIDHDQVAFDFSSDPLSQAEHEISIHEEPDSVGDVVLRLSLISAIPIVDDWEELVLDHRHCLFDYYKYTLSLLLKAISKYRASTICWSWGYSRYLTGLWMEKVKIIAI